MRQALRAPAPLLAVAVPVAVVLGVTVLAPARLAHAEAQVTLSASTGWTDNYNAETSETSDSVFLAVEPGIEAFFSSPATVQRLSYRLGLNYFITGSSASFSNNVAWDLTHTISEFTDSLVSAQVNHIATDTATPVAADPAGGLNALPGGANNFLSFLAGAGINHQFAELWRTNFGVNALYTTPVTADGFAIGKTFTGTGALGLGRDLQTGSVNLSLGGSFNWIEGLGPGADPAAGPEEDEEQVFLNAMVRYNRPLAPAWTLDLSAGALGAAPADDLGNQDIHPVGGAVLGWQSERHSAGLSYNRGVTLNPFLRQTIVADDVVARGGLPIAGTRWIVSGALGYQHAKTLALAEGQTETTLDLFSCDVAVGYDITPLMNLGGRYQLVYQDSDSAVIPDLVRNSISIVLTARYPDRTRTVMPFKQPLRMLRDPTLGEPDRPRGPRI